MSETIGQAEIPPKFDFPTRLPPMLVKELRQGLRTRGFVGGLILMQAVLLVVFGWELVAEPVTTGTSPSEIFFWVITGAVLLASGPLRALGTLGPEIELRTMDLLLLTRLDARRIVVGKWVSLQVQALLLLATLVPYAVVRYFFGSVDLARDAERMAMMFAAGAVFSGVGLWASGLPKAMRAMTVVVMIFVMPNLIGVALAGTVFAGMAFGGGVGSTSGWIPWTSGIWAGATVLVYALILAIRWVAPPAENHTLGPRLVPMVLAVPAGLWLALGEPLWGSAHLAMAALALAFVAALELTSTREPMAIHLRGWRSRGRGWRWVGGAALPGWASAARWLGVMLGLTAVVWVVVNLISGMDTRAGDGLRVLALAWAGMVFPLLPIVMLPSARKTTGALYFAAHAILGMFSIVAGNDQLAQWAPGLMGGLDWLAHAVPTASFWHALADWKTPSTMAGVWVGQTAGFVLTVVWAFWLGRGYWARVAEMRKGAGTERRG